MRLSVVIPFFNERENIVKLHEELLATVREIGFDYELIYVNDGSTDGSEQVFSELQECTVITLLRSYGQTAALSAGFGVVTGDVVATLDGDLQNDPSDLHGMLQFMDNNKLDMLVGWRKRRHDGWDKKIPSLIAFGIRQALLHDGIHDAGCGIKVFRRSVLDGLELYGEMHRFFVSIVKVRGYRVGEYVVNHRPRKYGKSKYSWKRGVKGFLDMVAVAFWGKYSARPLHLLGGVGIVVICVSFVTLFVSVFHVFTDFGLWDTQRWIIFSFLMFTLGIQLIVSGLIADIVVRGYFAASGKTGYIIREVTKL